jgi:hypothetical protein
VDNLQVSKNKVIQKARALIYFIEGKELAKGNTLNNIEWRCPYMEELWLAVAELDKGVEQHARSNN